MRISDWSSDVCSSDLAIVDGFRAAGLERPHVDTEQPDIRLHLHLDREQGSLSLDLAGASLHRRGYRARGVEAPLKENPACAILVRAGRSEERRVGTACVRKCKSRWSPYH